MNKTARLSGCGHYRYELGRRWDSDMDTLAVVMLNPSTADAEEDDPTIRRCISFAKRDGFGGIEVVNLFGYRATDPDDLMRTAEPSGEDNDDAIREVVRGRVTLCAWGASVPTNHADHVVLVEEIIRCYARKVVCLGTTKSGAPRHPLYVKGDTPMTPFALPKEVSDG